MGRIIRRGTKAKPRYYLKYRDADGIDRTRAAKGVRTKDQAAVLLSEIERRIMGGKVGIVEATPEERSRRTLTVQTLGELFIDEQHGYRSPKIKRMDRYRAEAKSKLTVRVYPHLGSKAAIAVRPIDVERFRDELTSAGLSPSSVTLTLAVLSKMYEWARKVGHIDCANPVKGCERPTSEPSTDYLSLDEVRSLLATVENTPMLPLIATAVYAGLRKGELFGLRWIDVHLDGSPRADVMKSYDGSPKSGKARHIPINAELAQILREWRKRCPTPNGLVFPVCSPTPRMGTEYDMLELPALLAAAGCHVPDKPWHALRHTFASHFMMAGGNILTLQRLLGHSTLAMTMRYAHLAPDYMAGEVAKMSFAPATPASVTSIRGLG